MGIRAKNVAAPQPLLSLLVVVLLPLTARSVDVQPDRALDGTTTNQVGLPSARSRQGARFANKYPACPDERVDPKLTDAEAAAVIDDDGDPSAQRSADVKYLIAAVESSGVRSAPFKSSVHICQAFHEELFEKLFQGFPPKSILYTLGERRWKGELDQLTSLNAKARATW